MNKVEISNMALNAIGARPIVSLTDESSQEAKTIALLYDPNMEEVLSMHPWPSATRRVRISAVPESSAGENLSKWEYRYQLPNNCITVLSMLSPDNFEELDLVERSRRAPELSDYPIFEREGDTLYSNASPGVIKYIFFPEDSDDLRDILAEAVAMRLAYKAALRLGRDANIVQMLDVRFNDMFLRARMSEATDRRRDPKIQRDWTQYRGHSRSRDNWVPQ